MRFEPTKSSRKRRQKVSARPSSRRVYSSIASSQPRTGRKKRKIGRKLLGLIVIGVIGWQGYANKDTILGWFDRPEKPNVATTEQAAPIDSIGVSKRLAETIRQHREIMLETLELPDTTVLYKANTDTAADAPTLVSVLNDSADLTFWQRINPTRLMNNLFSVQDVRISGVLSISQDTIQTLIGDVTDQGMFDLDLEALAERVNQHSRVQHTVIRRRLPSTLMVDVQERREIMLVVSSGKLLGVDREGVVLGEPNPGWPLDAPVVTGYHGKLNPGEMVEDPGLLSALTWARHASNRPLVGDWISEMHLDNGIVDFVQGAGNVQVQPGDHAIVAQVAALHAFLAGLGESKNENNIVDMRFPGFIILKHDEADRRKG